jgi:acetyltransferase-like isoleucine patch superfamily enzyme
LPYVPSCRIVNPDNLIFDINDRPRIFQSGCLLQAIGKITIGKGTWISQNVGIITANHDFEGNLDENAAAKDVTIGERCWIGMNSVILPGVILGDRTIVGAGSVVTHSFPEGYCVIAGNPAKIIRRS